MTVLPPAGVFCLCTCLQRHSRSLKSGVISRPSPLLSTAASDRKALAEQSREELTKRSRREGESVGAFAADIRVYARKGYPTFPAAAMEELHAFLRGLTPERLHQHVRLLSPRDLSEALREAEWAEEVLQAGPVTGRSPLQRQLTRAAERGVDGVQPEEEEVIRAQPVLTP
ncbi:golgin subfamily A member 6 6 [Labeo rohita]|uniref:Golgin subfamily A member 6 6 n=1 Tax=Labeo rohita TaxID=84645 RepID=A0A498NQY7_LABRO|nr:golgin subfamily A member 6 6 [Labeo rohita]